jgi:Na+/pantothenate symporter
MALLPASAMADNSLYQRMLSMRDQSRVITAFVLGGCIMVITIAGMGIMAATVFVSEVEPPRPHLAHVMQLTEWAHPIMMIMFVCALLSACASTIDSALNSVGSVWANTVWRFKNTVTTSRMTIAVVMIISVFLSWLRIDLWILITTFGVLRLMIVVPTIYTAVARTVKPLDAWSIFAGIMMSAAFVTATRMGVITVSAVSEAWITVMIPVIPMVCMKLISRAMRRTNRA